MIGLSLLLLISSCVYGKESVVLRSREAGFFSIFFDVMALLLAYENKSFQGVEVNFDTTGYYYDPTYGPNWWIYYFEPISLGIHANQKLNPIMGGYPFINPNFITGLPRHQVFQLIQKYVKIQAPIKSRINQFIKDHFIKYRTIGVHFRGTDKVTEVPLVPFDRIAKRVMAEVARFQTDDYKIFIASDEWNFIDYMLNLFGDKVCYYQDSLRSTNGQPLHIGQANPRKQGEDALVDCFSLACTDLLIRTSSNLSLCASFFNPYIPVIEIN